MHRPSITIIKGWQVRTVRMYGSRIRGGKRASHVTSRLERALVGDWLPFSLPRVELARAR